MNLPDEVPVMTLPNATLFPQALLPLYIFETRYRQMLADALHGNRMLSVAMRKPNSSRETPAEIAGVGLIRVSVAHKDSTSHLILQGLTRVKLGKVVKYRPYRVQQIEPLPTPPSNDMKTGALLVTVRELLKERVLLGMPFPFPFVSQAKPGTPGQPPPAFSAKEVIGYLDSINDPDQAADLVSCAVLAGAEDRQTILETLDVEARLRQLAQFLLRDIQTHPKRKKRSGQG
jgi:ATP-dependent Lon protease